MRQRGRQTTTNLRNRQRILRLQAPRRLPDLLPLSLIILALFAIFIIYELYFAHPVYAPVPAKDQVLNLSNGPSADYYDAWGTTITSTEALSLTTSLRSPANGVVHVTRDLTDKGRNSFYEDTFHNENFLSDIVGFGTGPFNDKNIARAIFDLHGQQTSNLRVALDQDSTVGAGAGSPGRVFHKGDLIDTGLVVPKGGRLPLGLAWRADGTKARFGVTCALCHARLDEASGKVVEGAPNTRLNLGLLLALAPNSASLFRYTGVTPSKLPPGDTSITQSDGQQVALPDSLAFENAVDRDLLSWPIGSVDSTPDLHNNPTTIPRLYTNNNWPYGWSGEGSAGPFKGLTVKNNQQALLFDPLADADNSKDLFGLDREYYIGLILQNSALAHWRLPPERLPSDFLLLTSSHPDTAGIIDEVKLPGGVASPVGFGTVWASSPGLPFGTQLNSLAAWENTLMPPSNNAVLGGKSSFDKGALLFKKAGCIGCHVGTAYTNNNLVRAEDIKTQPSRALALQRWPDIFDKAQLWPFDSTLPIDPKVKGLTIPLNKEHIEDIHLLYWPFAIESPADENNRGVYKPKTTNKGAYKVMGLNGLYLSSSLLHDGGVSISGSALTYNKDGSWTLTNKKGLGIPGTTGIGIPADPAASLLALLDRDLRQNVITANQGDPRVVGMNITGEGHEYWVDQGSGYSNQDQSDLINFLLGLDLSPVKPTVTIGTDSSPTVGSGTVTP